MPWTDLNHGEIRSVCAGPFDMWNVIDLLFAMPPTVHLVIARTSNCSTPMFLFCTPVHAPILVRIKINRRFVRTAK